MKCSSSNARETKRTGRVGARSGATSTGSSTASNGSSSSEPSTPPMSVSRPSRSHVRKHKPGLRTVWGDPKKKSDRSRFLNYLQKLTSAQKLISRGGVLFYRGLPEKWRLLLAKRLREVDQEGFRRFLHFVSRVRKYKRKETEFLLASPTSSGPGETDDLIALTSDQLEQEGIEKVQFIHLGGLRNFMAMYLAAGNTPDELCALLKIEKETLGRYVSMQDVTEAQKKSSEAIVKLADAKVLKDMLGGNVTDDTNKADLIASRRRNMELKVLQLARRRDNPLLPTEREAIEKRYVDRFGVKRVQKIVDVEPTEEQT